MGLDREAPVGGDVAVVCDGAIAHGEAVAERVNRDGLRGDAEVDLGVEACVARNPKRREFAIAGGPAGRRKETGNHSEQRVT